MSKYPKPKLFKPTEQEAAQAAKWLNSRLTTKRVSYVNGIPIDINGNVSEKSWSERSKT